MPWLRAALCPQRGAGADGIVRRRSVALCMRRSAAVAARQVVTRSTTSPCLTALPLPRSSAASTARVCGAPTATPCCRGSTLLRGDRPRRAAPSPGECTGALAARRHGPCRRRCDWKRKNCCATWQHAVHTLHPATGRAAPPLLGPCCDEEREKIMLRLVGGTRCARRPGGEEASWCTRLATLSLPRRVPQVPAAAGRRRLRGAERRGRGGPARLRGRRQPRTLPGGLQKRVRVRVEG